MSFDTESAWSACEEFFDELNKVLGRELSISYREIFSVEMLHSDKEYFLYVFISILSTFAS
ncbi:MAG TPA: hypothetical protein DD401_07460 [Prevotella sp.]|nr:hypothetical protein [Prevotella sp.]